MANVTITGLPPALGLNGTEQLEAVQSGSSVRITVNQITQYAQTAGTIVWPITSGGTGANNAADARTNLGLGTMSTQDASNVNITGGSITGISITITSINGTPVGNLSPDTGAFTTLSATSLTLTNPLAVAYGGTGQSSALTQYGVIYGASTTAMTNTAAGTTGQVLVGNTGGAPTWSSTIPATAGVTTLSFGTTGLTPATATSGAITVAGTLAVANGGTGQSSSLTQYGLVYGSTSSAMATIAAGTTGQFLVGNTGAAPSWSSSLPSTLAVTSITFGTTGLTPATSSTGAVTVAGTLVAANGGTGQSSYTVGDILYADTTTSLAKLADVNLGSVLVSGGVGSAPLWSSSPDINGTLTANYLIADGSTTGSRSKGAISYGTMAYTDTNVLASFQSSVDSYNELIIQNTNNGASASANIIVSNDLGTSSTYYGEFGMNSSAFSGTGPFGVANNVYLSATSADLVIGTATSNSINFVINSASSAALSINTSSITNIQTLTLSNALGATYGGTGQSTYAVGDILYASASGTLSKLAAVATGSVLVSQGVTTAPAYSSSPTVTTLNATTVTATVGAGFQNMVVQTTGTGATYNLPAALQVTGAKFKLTIVGAGGQGGGTTTTAGMVGGGGGAGGVVVAYLTYVAGQNSLTYTVGTGGSGAGTNAAGTAGGNSSVVYNSITYTAGGGGGGPTATTTGSGTGGTATGGTLNIAGQTGGAGGTQAATANMLGNGGDPGLGLGSGAPCPSATGTGTAASSGYGGGGSGGWNGATATARAGGAGANGVVIIEY